MMLGIFVSDSHRVITTLIVMLPFKVVLLWRFLCNLMDISAV